MLPDLVVCAAMRTIKWPVKAVVLFGSLAAEADAAGAGWVSVQAGVVARLDIMRRGGQLSAEECAKAWSALSQGKRDSLDEAAFTTGCDLTPAPLP